MALPMQLRDSPDLQRFQTSDFSAGDSQRFPFWAIMQSPI